MKKIILKDIEEFMGKHYRLSTSASPLPGEIDLNFLITADGTTKYIFKVAASETILEYIDFQEKLLTHLSKYASENAIPALIENSDGDKKTWITVDNEKRIARLLTWIDGRLWSEVNPIDDSLLFSLGVEAGRLTSHLQGFSHPYGQRSNHWDIDQAEWMYEHIEYLDADRRSLVLTFLQAYEDSKNDRKLLRKGIIHNDANDNNILVTEDVDRPEVRSIIDYGDAIFTTLVNDVSVAITYAIMCKPDPLATALQIVKGYHESFPLLDEEVKHIYDLVGIRLSISLTKSAINKHFEPENTYLQISDQPAWELIQKWGNLNKNFAYYSFRHALGLLPHPDYDAFVHMTLQHTFLVSDLFPTLNECGLICPDMSIDSTLVGLKEDYTDDDHFEYLLKKWNKNNPNTIPANGYLEVRPFYSTDAFRKEGNNGPEYRTVHLGVDFWVNGHTPLHTPITGEIYSVFDNDQYKDYGPTIIIRHEQKNIQFYTLYGHLSKSTLHTVYKGQRVKKGDLIGYIGNSHENGHWAPHLHFQIILDLMGFEHDFPGVAFPKERDIWSSICPDPNLFLKSDVLSNVKERSVESLIQFRKSHLGKSLSLSYSSPLQILRGEGTYLYDADGRKYLDTVNNVAHVGHENPRVVRAGQHQMAILNTNTRYLHPIIQQLTESLLQTLPPELCVVHYVNSGSEANELALRMAYTHTGQKDIIALDHGYHGNTNAVIDVSAYKFNSKGGFGQRSTTHLCPLPDTFRGLHRGSDVGQLYAAYVVDIVSKLKTVDKMPAAFIHESIVSCGGQVPLPEFFLQKAYESIRQAGGLCIADEVQTGCGRIGTQWWAFQDHGVTPDIVTIGKPLGNGHPVAAVICTRAVADSFANGMEYFNTFGGNPVSCAIGKEVLDVIHQEGLMSNAITVGNIMLKGLTELKSRFPIIADVRGEGLFLGFELTDDQLQPLAKQTSILSERMKTMGILTSTDGPDHNVIKIKPPLTFSISNADQFLDRLSTILKEDRLKIK
ncbi:MAG: aminotransferase class III-fold pyridoxal phosphate-dependent enzyme [Saprospiraceae bacterium]